MSLKPSTNYYYRVKALNSTQESEYSNTVQVTTLSDATSLVTPLPASNPSYRSNSVTRSSINVFIDQLPFNEYIQELKVTVSTNLDFSSPIYNNLTYVLDENTSDVTVSNNSYIGLTIGNLLPDTLYYIRLRASNSISLSGNTDVTIRTARNITSPIALGVTNLTAINATANWTRVEGTTSYFIDVATDSNFSTLIINNLNVGNNLSYTIPVLVEQTSYFYRVRSFNGTLTSANSNVISFVTLDGANSFSSLTFRIAAPQLRAITGVFTDRLTFNWQPVLGVTGYTVNISTSATFDTLAQAAINTTNTSTVLTNLLPGTLYFVRVRSNHPQNSSSFTSTSITTLVTDSLLNPPQVLTPTNILSTGVIISWVKRTYATNYLLQVASNNSFTNNLFSYFLSDIDTYLLDGLTPATPYFVRIFALNSLNTSISSNIINITTAALPPAILLSPASDITDYSARISWTGNPIYIKYLLSVYKVGTGNSSLGNGFYFYRDIGNSSNFLIDLFLEPGNTYKYIISGVTSDGDQIDSLEDTFTTKFLAPSITISDSGKSLEWSGQLNRVEASTDKNFKFLKRGWNPRSVTGNSLNIEALITEDINYYLRAFFTDENTLGEYSNVIATNSSIDIQLLPIVVTSTTALIRWKKVESTNYRIQIMVDNGTNFLPIAGHTFPIALGDIDNFYLENLTADTNYSVSIQYLEKDGTFSIKSIPVIFRTNRFSNTLTGLVENNTLTLPTVTTTATFDSINFAISGTYTRYIIQMSLRQDFLAIDDHIEVMGTNPIFTYGNRQPNTNYWFRIYGISGTDRTPVVNANILTSNLPAFSSALTGVPTLSNSSVLNENEALIQWQPIVGARGYTIEISRSNTFNILDLSVSITSVGATRAVLGNLSGALVYYVRIYAFNDNSLTGYSNTLTIDTTP